jgi:hypothetical protein
VNAPTTLEALAAEIAGTMTRAVRRELLHDWADRIRAYLAARPASDLEKRLRERAARHADLGWENDAALDIEAADALASAAYSEADGVKHQQEQAARIAELEQKYLGACQHVVNVECEHGETLQRVAGLERELAEEREAHQLEKRAHEHNWRQKALAQDRLAAVTTEVEAAERDNPVSGGMVTCTRLRLALATPAQVSEEGL